MSGAVREPNSHTIGARAAARSALDVMGHLAAIGQQDAVASQSAQNLRSRWVS
jgi:hypothetical protein